MEEVEQLIATVAADGFVEEKFLLVGLFLQLQEADVCSCELCTEQRKYYRHEMEGLITLEDVLYYSMCRDSLMEIDPHLVEVYAKNFLETMSRVAPAPTLGGLMWRHKLIAYVPPKLHPLFWGPEID